MAAILLSVSALGTSWAGYQATRWNGAQTTMSSESALLRTRSTRASTAAGQQHVIDVGVFASWLEAYGHGDSILADFYARRFRPEFATAFHRWLGMRPLVNANVPPTPFAMPEYRLALDGQAAQFEAAADRADAAARQASANGDAYVLEAVILATVMFFGGAAQQAGSIRVQVVLAAIALLVCVGGIIRLVMLPRY